MVTAKATRTGDRGPWIRQYRWLLAGLLGVAAVAAGVVYALGNFTGCRPTFADDFNFWWLDPYQWNVKYNSGRNELQYYAPDAFQVSGGLLRITAEPRPQQGYAYSSGIITTKNIFAQKYGYFEMRAQLPAGQGLWPAFWLLHSGPAGGDEIDIMEMLGHDPNTIYVSNHWHDEANQLQGQTQPVTSADFSSGLHTFGLNWTPDKLAWYVDGVKQAESTDHVPAGPMFILANLAVGGTWPGYPDATTPFPAVMSIDYIRVYPAGCLPAGLVDATATPAGDAGQDSVTQQP